MQMRIKIAHKGAIAREGEWQLSGKHIPPKESWLRPKWHVRAMAQPSGGMASTGRETAQGANSFHVVNTGKSGGQYGMSRLRANFKRGPIETNFTWGGQLTWRRYGNVAERYVLLVLSEMADFCSSKHPEPFLDPRYFFQMCLGQGGGEPNE